MIIDLMNHWILGYIPKQLQKGTAAVLVRKLHCFFLGDVRLDLCAGPMPPMAHLFLGMTDMAFR